MISPGPEATGSIAAEHGDLDLAAGDGLLDDDPLVVRQGVVDGVAQLLDVVGLGHPDRRAHVRRLDEARQAELGGQRAGQAGGDLGLAQRPVAALRDAVGGEHLLGHRLVHRQRRAEHAGSDVGGVGELEQPLHGAVLAHRAVQQGQHDGDLVVGVRRPSRRGDHVGHRDRRTGGVEPVGKRAGTGGEGGLGGLAERPVAVGRDADRRDPVLRRVDRRQHVGRRDAADVVLGGLAAVEHDEMDAAHRRNGTVDADPARERIGRCRYRSRAVRFRASDVAAATGGRLVGDDVELDGASFDTRTLDPGELFVPLVAERDGHDFIADAAAAPVRRRR